MSQTPLLHVFAARLVCGEAERHPVDLATSTLLGLEKLGTGLEKLGCRGGGCEYGRRALTSGLGCTRWMSGGDSSRAMSGGDFGPPAGAPGPEDSKARRDSNAAVRALSFDSSQSLLRNCTSSAAARPRSAEHSLGETFGGDTELPNVISFPNSWK